MRCINFRKNLALYDELTDARSKVLLEGHLSACANCRERLAEFRMLKADLRGWKRPQIPNVVTANLRHAVLNELLSGAHQSSLLSISGRELLQFRIMPYAVGTLATFLFAFLLLSAISSGNRTGGSDLAFARRQSVETAMMISPNVSTEFSAREITQRDYAAARLAFAAESPSLNPSGALLAVTNSLMRGKMKNSEVVFVADVLSNGMAKVTEMVEPPSTAEDLLAIENALQTDPESSPFVPAIFDQRSDVVRVVLKFQRVDVHPKTTRNSTSRKLR